MACSLAAHCQVTSSGDSHLGYLALQKNLARNGLAADRVNFVPASAVAEGPFDWVLVRVPKTLALLEEQLIRLHGQLAPGARVIAGAMIKHLPRAAGDLLEQYIGPVQASLALKKARLLTATPEARPAPISPYPTRYRLERPAIELLNHANVFCREGLDIGTRAFLPHLPKSLVPQRVADLGEGAGLAPREIGRASPGDSQRRGRQYLAHPPGRIRESASHRRPYGFRSQRRLARWRARHPDLRARFPMLPW